MIVSKVKRDGFGPVTLFCLLWITFIQEQCPLNYKYNTSRLDIPLC